MADEIKKAKPSLARGYIEPCMVKGAKDKTEHVENVMKMLKQDGATHNSKSKVITKEGVLSLTNAIIADVNNKRKGWWSGYDYVANKESVKFVPNSNFAKVTAKPEVKPVVKTVKKA